MPSGVVQNGWPYVAAAFSLTYGVFALYALGLFLRLRKAKEDR